MGEVVDATQISIASASHLDCEGRDAGAIAALLALARKIDDWDLVVDHIIEQIEMDPESKLRPPASDNVSLPTYLKYCAELGLTPASRGVLSKPEPAKVENELEQFKKRKSEGA